MSAIIKCGFALVLVVLHRCLFGDLMPVDVYEHLEVPVVEEGTVFSWPKNYGGKCRCQTASDIFREGLFLVARM